MLCAALGIVIAVIIRLILSAARIGEYVIAPPLTYACVAAAATMLVWLLWFGN